MNVSLPRPWEEFVASQVTSGEYGNASEVVREALRLLREQQESHALEEMRGAFADIDAHGGEGEPGHKDRALIESSVRQHRERKRRG
jgi:antitoxin ParD1/3/4